MSVLYISYDGILEPLGQSQVLAYLNFLSKHRRIYLISFEKPEDWDNASERNRITASVAASGILWYPLRYHKKPSSLATLWDIVCGFATGLFLVLRYRLRIVHARSYVSSVIALLLKRFTGVKYVFDMRGFWADERVDGGLWPKGGSLYRAAKWFERHFLLNADLVVSLTHAAVTEINTFSYLQGKIIPFEVITTCADLNLFHPRQMDSLSHPSDRPFTLGYVGSVGVWYLFDETLRCFKLLRKQVPDARLYIVNRGGHAFIHERLQAMGIAPDLVRIEAADPGGVALAMQEMDAGIFIIKPVYSKIASAPTKLGEFLGCGVPCLGNTGVGDMAAILENEQVGVALNSFDDASMSQAITRLLELTKKEDIKTRCRSVALRYYSLDEGVRRYASIYKRLE
ncbi:glycosyltransferase family 4 protein [Chlorobium sp. BLA1]|uniref:glycosyltransferase family 4 protein n=1 Tax=Candidatus Chlorobium masyuteum TaxID=2716876 RepID=UPI00142201F4|nr:glycosyltransferase family 4 protein [Candidatus Chlorobium masyuteum]NHQ59224.1 glycosyltransferase family 4 protein [Candidatus Chlorobium masyuteum]